jgi:hypothetical protein
MSRFRVKVRAVDRLVPKLAAYAISLSAKHKKLYFKYEQYTRGWAVVGVVFIVWNPNSAEAL